MSCNSAIHVTCLLALTTCKYNELQGQLQNTRFSHSVSHIKTDNTIDIFRRSKSKMPGTINYNPKCIVVKNSIWT